MCAHIVQSLFYTTTKTSEPPAKVWLRQSLANAIVWQRKKTVDLAQKLTLPIWSAVPSETREPSVMFHNRCSQYYKNCPKNQFYQPFIPTN